MRNKFPINLSQFKKVHDAEDHAVLKHPAGHEFKIAKRPLSPKMRGEIERLPMAHGGEAHMAMQFGGARYADGGEAEEHPIGETEEGQPRSSVTLSSGPMKGHTVELDEDSKQAKEAPGSLPSPEPTPKTRRDEAMESIRKAFADGGQVSDDEIIKQKAEVDEYNKTHEDEPKEYPDAVQKRMRGTDVTPQKYAEGGDIDYEKAFKSAGEQPSGTPAPQAPVNINIGSAQPTSAPAQGPQDAGGMPVASSPQDLGQGMAAKEPAAPASPQQASQPQQPSAQAPQLPTTMGGYQQQVSGIQEESAAQAALAKQSEAIAKGQAQAGMDLMNKFQSHYEDINQEYQNTMDDIKNQHIDPQRYLGQQDSYGKFMTSVGLILGGMGGMGGGNQALDFLNRQIDRDIDAQKAQLGQKETLLSANLRQFGNLRDATDMTRSMMSGIAQNQFLAAQSKASTPIAKARADQMIGQLQQQIAPTMQTLAMRQMLMSGQGAGSTEEQDPASFVPFVVPPDRQKDVLHEIGQAENTVKNKSEIMQHFDEAVKENSLGGRAMHAGFTPPSILAMRSMMLPIIHDAEGRVNEFEQRTTSDLEPKPFDTSATVAAKRQALQEFLTQKSSAPNAKAFGIDLARFKPTSQNPEAQLTPQQQSFVRWARSNPGNPKAQMVLKRLGIQ